VRLAVSLGTILVSSFLTASSHGQALPAEQPLPSEPRVYRTTESRIAIGRSITVASDEEVSDAVIAIGGSVRVDGRIRNDLIVVGGGADIGPQAEIRGDIVVVGGTIERAAGARVYGRVSNVSIGEWSSIRLGGLYLPSFTFGHFGHWFALFGAIFRVSLLAVLMIIALVIARVPVARIGQAAAAAPGRAFVAGLVAEVLFIPAVVVASIALVITIIGIPLVVMLVPLAILTGAVAMVLGFTALATRVGEWIEDRLGWRGHNAFAAAALGMIVIVAPTLVARVLGVAPGIGVAGFFLLTTGIIVEFVIWTTGLGATLMTGFGRWSIVPPPVPPPAMPAIANA
jgi:hypothetical protein